MLREAGHRSAEPGVEPGAPNSELADVPRGSPGAATPRAAKPAKIAVHRSVTPKTMAQGRNLEKMSSPSSHRSRSASAVVRNAECTGSAVQGAALRRTAVGRPSSWRGARSVGHQRNRRAPRRAWGRGSGRFPLQRSGAPPRRLPPPATAHRAGRRSATLRRCRAGGPWSGRSHGSRRASSPPDEPCEPDGELLVEGGQQDALSAPRPRQGAALEGLEPSASASRVRFSRQSVGSPSLSVPQSRTEVTADGEVHEGRRGAGVVRPPLGFQHAGLRRRQCVRRGEPHRDGAFGCAAGATASAGGAAHRAALGFEGQARRQHPRGRPTKCRSRPASTRRHVRTARTASHASRSQGQVPATVLPARIRPIRGAWLRRHRAVLRAVREDGRDVVEGPRWPRHRDREPVPHAQGRRR